MIRQRLVSFLVLMALVFPDWGEGSTRSYGVCPPVVSIVPVCEQGNLADWHAFVTANGTLGGQEFPQCVAFDVDRDGVPTESIRVKVGRVEFRTAQGTWEGGGIEKTLLGNGQWVVFGVDVAVAYRSSSDRRNLAGGLFELLVDGVVIARRDFGAIETGATRHARLEGSAMLPRGPYVLSIRIRRPFRSLPGTPAPYQYVSRVEIESQMSDCGKKE